MRKKDELMRTDPEFKSMIDDMAKAMSEFYGVKVGSRLITKKIAKKIKQGKRSIFEI